MPVNARSEGESILQTEARGDKLLQARELHTK